MPISVTEPLLKDHNQLRELIGEFKSALDQFSMTGLRRAARAIKDIVGPHTLKEESVLYLIGMRSLRADNEKIPELFREHHELADRMTVLLRALYSPQLTNVEDLIRNQVVVISQELLDHIDDEEKNVWPALEKLIDDKTKQLILDRMRRIAGSEEDELLDRAPLISMPGMPDDQMPGDQLSV